MRRPVTDLGEAMRGAVELRIGDRIRIVHFSKQFMDSLLPGDHDQISEMIGNVFEVEEVDG
jgi:hypothetical protein